MIIQFHELQSKLIWIKFVLPFTLPLRLLPLPPKNNKKQLKKSHFFLGGFFLLGSFSYGAIFLGNFFPEIFSVWDFLREIFPWYLHFY